MPHACLRHALQGFTIGRDLRRGDRFEQRFRTLVGGTQGMEPQRHLALPVGTGKTLAKAQLPALNGSIAAAALRPPGGCDFEDMGHAYQLAKRGVPRGARAATMVDHTAMAPITSRAVVVTPPYQALR